MLSTVYWISTILISAFLLVSSYTYFFSSSTIEGVRQLGFPDFFRIQLGILKLLAAVILVLKILPTYVKEWAYAGTALFLVTAVVAHIAHRDSKWIQLLLVILMVILIISWYTYHKTLNNN